MEISIAGMSIGMHQANLQNLVSVSLLNMTMDNAVIMGNEMTNMMEYESIDIYKGGNIDEIV